MLTLLTIAHVLIALIIILIVLLQSAEGSDLAGAFGGMGSQTAFGPTGAATFMQKLTVVLAAAFMVTSLTLAIFANRSRGTTGSVLSGEQANPTSSQPAAPAGQIPNPKVTVTPEPIPPPAAKQPSAPATPAAPAAPKGQ